MANILVKKIVTPYANALLSLATEGGYTTSLIPNYSLIHPITSDLINLSKLFHSTPVLKKYLSSPIVPFSIKQEIIINNISPYVSSKISKFLLILLNRSRIDYLEDITVCYLNLISTLANIENFEILSANIITKDQKAKLVEKLKQMTPTKKINLIIKVDKSLIGGFLVKINSKVIDLTVKGQIKQISKYLNVTLEF